MRFKMKSKIPPYLTIVVTNTCNFKCSYCSPIDKGCFGEGYGTKSQQQLDISDLKKKIKIIELEGITKVRLTGGEPLIVPGVIDVLKFLETKTNLEYALVTNGSVAHRFIDEFDSLPRLDLRISFDSLREERFNSFCGVNHYKRVLVNIKRLAKKRILKRIDMVVMKDNIDEIDSMINFCEDLEINLKLLDVYAVPETKKFWKSKYSALSQATQIIKKRAGIIKQYDYTRSFGIPTFDYKLPSGIIVRIKDSKQGTRYSKYLCKNCQSFPCQEGIYTILYSSDKKLIPCRLSPVHLEAQTLKQFRINLRRLIKVFQNSYYQNKFWK